MATNKEIRAWATAQGVEVGVRGRLSKAVKVDYFEQHPHEARLAAQAKGLKVGVKGRLPKAIFNEIA